MGNFDLAVVFVLTFNVLMFLTQATVMELNPTGYPTFLNEEGTLLNDITLQAENEGVIDTANIPDQLPRGEVVVSEDSGNFFTDTFSKIRDWFTQSTGLNYVKGILSAPYNFLKAMNLPSELVRILGTFWYGLTLFLVVAFFLGK